MTLWFDKTLWSNTATIGLPMLGQSSSLRGLASIVQPSSLEAKLRVSDGADRLRIERVLAVARLLLAFASLISVSLTGMPTGRAAWLLGGYALFAIALFIAIRARQDVSRRFAKGVHACDMVWPAVIMSATAGPESPFYALVQFPLLGAAYRWDAGATLKTALITMALLATQSVAWHQLGLFSADDDVSISRLIVRSSFMFVLAALAGVLSSVEKRRRGESAVIARIVGYARVDQGFKASLQQVLTELMMLFGAARAELTSRDPEGSALVIWSVDRAQPGVLNRSLTPRADAELVFPLEIGETIYVSASHADAASSGERATLDARATRAILATAYRVGEMDTRLVLVEPTAGEREVDRQLFERLVQYTAPALHNVYLYGRFRSRISDTERARIARELHDSAIQSTIAADLELQAVRRTTTFAPPVEAALERVQQLLRDQARLMRELTERLKPLNLGDKNFIGFLTNTVDRFRRDTGIDATVVATVDDLVLSPRIARELGRIVQEALANIRRHSGARSARVRLRVQDNELILLIEDDGQGFDFEGRLESEALDRSWRGPLVLYERAQAIGATLAVESTRGVGSRVEVTLRRLH